MPVNHNALVRYLLIDQALRKKGSLTRHQLADFVIERMEEANLKPITSDQVKKDLSNMKRELYVPLERDTSSNRWSYTDKDYRFLNLPDDIHFRLLNFLQFQEIFGYEELAQVVQFERGNTQPPENHLFDLGNAIKLKRCVRFHYKRFNSEWTSERVVEPYLLKENRNRWYLIGRQVEPACNDSGIRIFGLDRIDGDIDRLDRESYPDGFKPNTYFRDSIGITVSHEEPVWIVFDVWAKQAPYLETNPWHESLKKVSEDNDWARFRMYVRPTFEVYANLFSLGERVCIISPQSVREEVQRQLQAALKAYED